MIWHAADKAACLAERHGAVNQGYFPIGQTSNLYAAACTAVRLCGQPSAATSVCEYGIQRIAALLTSLRVELAPGRGARSYRYSRSLPPAAGCDAVKLKGSPGLFI